MTTPSQELAHLFRRDLAKLHAEIAAFPAGDALWRTLPGITNSAGNLALHLEGNLREFVGRQLGGVAYTRNRPLEFSARGVPAAELLERLRELEQLIPEVVAALPAARLEEVYPENVLGSPMTVRHFLIHLHGHLTYHMGQANYLRRVLVPQS